MQKLIHALLFYISGIVPRNRKKLVFGAWLGKRFSDNPLYLMLYFAEKYPGLKLIWIGDKMCLSSIQPSNSINCYLKESLRAYWEMLTAGYCFVSHNVSDVGKFNLMCGAKRFYLGHGIAIKHMGGIDSKLKSRLATWFRAMVRNSYSFHYYIASSWEHHEKLFAEQRALNIKNEQIIHVGQPRVDFLIENSKDNIKDGLKKEFCKKNTILNSTKIISYLPTWRDKKLDVFSFFTMEKTQFQQFDQMLRNKNAVIFEKSHFADQQRNADNVLSGKELLSTIRSLQTLDTHELLLFTDILITDYSGCYIDFLVLNRPVIHYAYDRIEYEQNDRGLYFNLDDVAGGPIVSNLSDLRKCIEGVLMGHDDSGKIRAKCRDRFCEYETGLSRQMVAELVIDTKKESN